MIQEATAAIPSSNEHCINSLEPYGNKHRSVVFLFLANKAEVTEYRNANENKYENPKESWKFVISKNMSDNNPGNDMAGGSGDDNKRTAVSSYNEDDRKLRALAGQWKTPPMPIYASAKPSATLSGNDKSSNIATPANLPGNSEDYAKALQEAYLQGAEHAAILAQQHQIPSAASCPDFSTGSSAVAATPPTTNTLQMDHQIHPPHQHPMSTSIPDPLKSSMPPPLPQSATTSTVHHQHHPPQTQITYAPQHLAEQQPYLQTQQSQPPQYAQQITVPQPVAASSVAQRPLNAVVPTQSKSQQPGRSLSMPDMSTYAAEAEEEKRLKRLARNRASARLRRLRKKNLVSMLDKIIYRNSYRLAYDSNQYCSFFPLFLPSKGGCIRNRGGHSRKDSEAARSPRMGKRH